MCARTCECSCLLMPKEGTVQSVCVCSTEINEGRTIEENHTPSLHNH